MRRQLTDLRAAVSDQGTIEESLRRSEDRYRAVTENAFAGITITDPDENITFANPAAVRMLGYTKDELLGINLSKLTDPNEFSRYREFTKQRKRGVENQYETHLYRKDGERISVLVSVSPLLDLQERLEGILAVAVDITDHRRAEEELRKAKEAYTERLEEMVRERTRELEEAQTQLIHSEKLAAMGKLAAGVAHEINNPAGVLLMKLKFLLSTAEEAGVPQRAVSSLQVSVDQVERIQKIVESLLTFSRQPEGIPVPTSINHAVATALRLTEHTLSSRCIEPELDLDQSLPEVCADPAALEQVVINLLNNASDAMPEGGRLKVRTWNASKDGWVYLSVEDDGVGIPSDYLSKVFDPFFTTKQVGEGTGLGLSISYGIIEKLGGRIEVQSTPEEGSTFTVRLPVKRG